MCPINLDHYKMSTGNNPLVKWEAKLEEMYDDIKSKNPYVEYIRLAPNSILLESIKNNEELEKKQSFLEELNNIDHFKQYDYFETPLFTDFMANKIHMKKLIVTIWYNIKK